MANKTIMPNDHVVNPEMSDFLAYALNRKPTVISEGNVEMTIDEMATKLSKFSSTSECIRYGSNAMLGLPAAYSMMMYLKKGRMDFWEQSFKEEDIKKLGLEIPAKKYTNRMQQLDDCWNFLQKIRETPYWKGMDNTYHYIILGAVAMLAHIMQKPQEKSPSRSSDIWLYYGIRKV